MGIKIVRKDFPFEAALQIGATRLILAKSSEYLDTNKEKTVLMKEAIKISDERQKRVVVIKKEEARIEGPNLGKGKYHYSKLGIDGQSKASVVYIPKNVRIFLNLDDKDFITFTVEDNKVVMKKAPKE